MDADSGWVIARPGLARFSSEAKARDGELDRGGRPATVRPGFARGLLGVVLEQLVRGLARRPVGLLPRLPSPRLEGTTQLELVRVLESGDTSSETPDGSEVPYPRLLARRENSPDHAGVPYDRARLREWASGLDRLRPERQDLRLDQPHDRLSAQGDRGDNPLRDLACECPGQAKEEHPVILSEEGNGKSERKQDASGAGGGQSSFLKLHSSFPPEFRARPGESWRDYWRGVEFWLASEGAQLPHAVRSSRLMQQLKERAAKIVNHLSVNEVSGEDGISIIKNEMEKSPIIRLLEHKEVDKRRQKFMKLARHAGESLESFINRASIYRHENDRCQNYKVGSKFYLGYLIDAARLTRKDVALVKTASGGLSDETKVINAMLELADQLEGVAGCPVGRGEPELHDEDEFLVQKGRGGVGHERDDRGQGHGRSYRSDKDRGKFVRDKKSGKFRRWKQVFHAMMGEDSEDSGPSEDQSDQGGSGLLEDDQDEADTPSDREGESSSATAPAEIYAQEYKAKKRVNEIKQMRQYFQKGSPPEKAKAWVREQQKKEPCFLCQKLGHWSQECPLRKKAGNRPAHSVSVTAGPPHVDPGQWSMLESIAEYSSGLYGVRTTWVLCGYCCRCLSV